MKGVVFPDPVAAQAAFALGPVRYRCWVCGKIHVSGSGGSSRCLARVARIGNWQVRVGPLPLRPYVPPSLAFALKVWEAIWSWPPDRVDVGEHLLAVDGLDPRMRAMVQEVLESLAQQYTAELDRLWALRDEYCRWVAALSTHRPPAAISGYTGTGIPLSSRESIECRLRSALREAISPESVQKVAEAEPPWPPGIGEYTVKPAVPLPAGICGGADTIALACEDLWWCLTMTGQVKSAWRRGVLVHVEYGRDGFMAMFQRKWGSGDLRYVVCLEQYGTPALVAEIDPGVGDPEKAAQALLARRAVR